MRGGSLGRSEATVRERLVGAVKLGFDGMVEERASTVMVRGRNNSEQVLFKNTYDKKK